MCSILRNRLCSKIAIAIAETRGSIGMAFLPNLERYVDGLKEMADVVGVDPDSFPRTTASRTRSTRCASMIGCDLALREWRGALCLRPL
jgi:hypothetical protein